MIRNEFEETVDVKRHTIHSDSLGAALLHARRDGAKYAARSLSGLVPARNRFAGEWVDSLHYKIIQSHDQLIVIART